MLKVPNLWSYWINDFWWSEKNNYQRTLYVPLCCSLLWKKTLQLELNPFITSFPSPDVECFSDRRIRHGDWKGEGGGSREEEAEEMKSGWEQTRLLYIMFNICYNTLTMEIAVLVTGLFLNGIKRTTNQHGLTTAPSLKLGTVFASQNTLSFLHILAHIWDCWLVTGLFWLLKVLNFKMIWTVKKYVWQRMFIIIFIKLSWATIERRNSKVWI